MVHFSLNEATVCSLQLADDYDSVYYWQAPDGMTKSLFVDFLNEVIDAISLDAVFKQDTKRFLDLLYPSAALLPELHKLNQRRMKMYKVSDDDTISILRGNLKSFEHVILPYPSKGIITRLDLRINNETDPSRELRRTINQSVLRYMTFYAESDVEDEKEESQDIYDEDIYTSDEEEDIEQEVQASPEKPCYYPSQIEMAAILKKRIDTIMWHYHNISRLRDAFKDIEFVVYTARYRMLSDQTEKRICHPNSGVLSKEELESRKRDCDGKKRMFMYVRSAETEKHFEELKKDVEENSQTLFVIVADECHWGITRDKEEKPSAHNLFINEWCKDSPPKNVIVVQISATPFNLLTQNSRLPAVPYVIRRDGVSTTSSSEYGAGDLVVLNREPDLEEHVINTSKKLELHVVHWSEVELKHFERGMRMKLKSALNIENTPYRYLQISTQGKLGVTSLVDHATEFIIQGSHGIVTLKAEQTQGKALTVTTDTNGNLEAKYDPPQPTEFEVKSDFGVGVVSFCSCKRHDHYIAVDETGYVSLQGAKIERKCGVCIMKPKHDVARVSFQFYIDQSGPMEVTSVGQQYMSLNYYLSTMNSANRKDRRIREDEFFQMIVDKAKRKRKTSQSDSPSFPIDALLCAEYCYHIIHVSVYNSDDKICQALTTCVEGSPATEFHSCLKSFKRHLNRNATGMNKYIDPEAFELVQREICDRVTGDFKENLKQVGKLSRQKSSKRIELKAAEEELATSFVACLMHLPLQELQELEEETSSVSNVEDVKQKLQENGCRAMVQKWHDIVQAHETSYLVEDLIQSGKGELGKMKIVRAKSMKTADQFYYTLQLTRKVSCLEECFEVIRDYGGIQIENQLMKSSSPFFQKLQPETCAYKFDCGCSELKLQTNRKKCANCQHVHKLITQYEDLENLACILILVDKGRMGDTFPQSFDCLDLRLNYDSSQEFDKGSAMYLSTLIQELGRMCRYAKSPTAAIPYVLIGRKLFKTLQKSLETSPSMSAISCTKADRYMTKKRKGKDTQSSALRWLDYEAHKDSYDHQNEQKHCNRILLQAEPQIGKTGTYLCLIRDLRLDIIGKEKVSLTSAAGFEEGTFYRHKESDNSEDSVSSEMDEWKDWQFPYWKTIENSPSLYEKPVGTGKYSIGGCFYTHDMEKSPFILLRQERQKPIKTGHQNLKSDDCTNGIRAWHWYHFENCAECGRLLQGKESILETVEVDIDGIPFNVKCSLPSTCPSFTHLMKKLQSAKSSQDDLTLPYWIFHPSHRDDPRKCTLNYHHVMQENGRVANYVQVVVVRSEKFEAYRSTWAKVLVILQLPEKLPNCDVGPDEGGIGYARLFIQKISFSLNLEYVFVIDDNMAMMSEAEFTTDATFGNERKVVRDDNGVMKMRRCSFLKPLTHLQKIVQGKDIPHIPDKKYEPHPLKDEFEARDFPLYTYTGPAKLFHDKKHGSYGILGLMRSIPKAVNPFAKTQVYAAVLLNVKSTVDKGVFYRPWPCWEDLRLNDDCDKAGLWVVKCNRYCFFKVQYKDWMNSLVLPGVFLWNENSSLMERPVESELPEDLEEEIILEHLQNVVNTNGPEKCFKGSIGYDRSVEEEVSPLSIVGKVKSIVVTEEDSAQGVPFLILSYRVETRTFENMTLLNSHFCRTKKKIVFVVSAKEVIKRWPQMTIGTLSTEQGICFCSNMSERNARFGILSAADPARHRLRWILIEASFPQDDQDIQAETCTSNGEGFLSNLMDTRNLPTLDEGTLSSLQNTRKTKSAKRSFQETLPFEFKRQKLEDDCTKRLDNSEAETLSSDDEVICLGSTCNQQTSQSGTWFRENSNQAREGGSSRRRSLDSIYDGDDLASDNKYLSHFDEAAYVEVENDSDVSLVSKTQQTPDSKREERNDYSSYIEGVNVVTKAIVDLWVECKKLSGSTKKVNQETGSSDLTMEYVQNKLAHFTVVQLEERDKNGYNALLKACSLPSMSPHVMQHLINTRIDINCQLLPDFDRHHPAGEGLIPGMSALSVAIKCRNVKSVQTFKKRGKEISLGIADEEGNTALHHCVFSCSKFAFSKLFPLYKEKKWKKMLNRDGKNPLHIATELESRKLSKVKQQSVIDMRKEMTKKTKNSRQSIEDFFRYIFDYYLLAQPGLARLADNSTVRIIREQSGMRTIRSKNQRTLENMSVQKFPGISFSNTFVCKNANTLSLSRVFVPGPCYIYPECEICPPKPCI